MKSYKESAERPRAKRGLSRTPENYSEQVGRATTPKTQEKLVRSSGFEPPRYCYRQPLKLVRLPIPPRPHSDEDEKKYIRSREFLGVGFYSGVTPLCGRSRAQFFGAGENSGNVFAAHVTQMKFAGERNAIRLVDDFRFGNGEKLVEHAIHADIARARLMDQAEDRRDIEICLDPVRI